MALHNFAELVMRRKRREEASVIDREEAVLAAVKPAN
jgi:hypothetical protein